MWRKKLVFNTRTPPRHITVFSTPAGTPGDGLPFIGDKIGEVHFGRYVGLGPRIDHWGILVEGQHGSDSTFFELYRPDGGIGVLRRSRDQRQREEGGSSAKKLYAKSDLYTFETWPGIEQVQREAKQKNDSMRLKYTNTGSMTTFTDDEIEECAKDICRTHMRGEYHLWKANCQTFVNLLLQRIVEGSAPFVPFGTMSHALGSGPSDKRLSMLSDVDKAKAMKLKGSPIRITPDFMLLRAKHNIPLLVFDRPDRPLDEQIDLNPAEAKEPLTIADIRKIAHFEATNQTGHPLLSLEAIRNYLDEHHMPEEQGTQEERGMQDEHLDEVFLENGAPVIVSDHSGEEKLFYIDNNNVWKPG